MSERAENNPTCEAKSDADQFAADVAYINRLMEPVCGEDFCEECGDCLACYEGEGGPCVHSETGHVWIMRPQEERGT